MEESIEVNEMIEIEIREFVTTRFNNVTKMVEYSTDGGVEYHPITDRMEKIILRKLRANGHKIGVNTVRNILNSDFSLAYDPFVDYYESLAKWDGETNYIQQLCNTVKTVGGDTFEEWFTKWIVGVVVSATNPDKVNHQVLVFTGGQGIGKTTWFEHLVPKMLSNYSNTGYVNPDSKDGQIQASECFLVNIDELSALTSKNMEAFKQLVTQAKMRVRRPYGVNPENLVKRASFCGSTNEEQFLIDYTGNRRFLCYQVEDIDLDMLSEIDMDKVYSQAYHLVESGFKYWFDKSDNELIEARNKEFVVKTETDEAINRWLTPCSKEDNSPLKLIQTATQTANYLAAKGSLFANPRNIQNIGKSLTKLGFTKYKSNGSMMYCMKMKISQI
jgi:predicted P-loop ATPase